MTWSSYYTPHSSHLGWCCDFLNFKTFKSAVINHCIKIHCVKLLSRMHYVTLKILPDYHLSHYDTNYSNRKNTVLTLEEKKNSEGRHTSLALLSSGSPYLDLTQRRPWSLSPRESNRHRRACQRGTEQLPLIARQSCNNHRRLILASPLPCSHISCDRAHIHRTLGQLCAEQGNENEMPLCPGEGVDSWRAQLAPSTCTFYSYFSEWATSSPLIWVQCSILQV